MIRRMGLASALALCRVAVLQLPVTSVSAYRTPELEGFPSTDSQEGSEAEYRIKPKDELDIRIEGACIYSTRFEVDGRGIIELPFADEVRAAGMTTAELASELARQLGKYLKDPKVHVHVIGAAPNKGMHPTRFSPDVIRQMECLRGCVRAGDAGR